MKKIMSASICAIAMAVAVPAFAADDAKPMMHHKHHMKGSHMMGPHTKMKPKGDPTTEDLNAKSLDAARGGSTAESAPAGAMSGPSTPANSMAPSNSMAPGNSMAPATPMAPPASGSAGMTNPSNAPGGQ